MLGHKLITDEAYLYDLCESGIIVERKGRVYKNEASGGCYLEIQAYGGAIVKVLRCAENEGEVYNKSVWLYESDKRKAADILIKYEEAEIAKLEFKIENHRNIIEGLRKI